MVTFAVVAAGILVVVVIVGVALTREAEPSWGCSVRALWQWQRPSLWWYMEVVVPREGILGTCAVLCPSLHVVRGLTRGVKIRS